MSAESRMKAAVASALMPDEEFLAGRVCVPNTVGAAAIGGVLGGAVGALAATAVQRGLRPAPPQQGFAARIPTDRKVAIVITTHRLLVFKTGGFGAGIREPIVGAGRRDLHSVEVRPAKIGFASVRVRFADGGAVELKLETDRKLDHLRHAFSRLGSRTPQASETH